MKDIIIIGAGIVGSFLARTLAKYQLDIGVIDKENDVGNVTSLANTALIHSGYDPVPGSLKAQLNVLGNAMYPTICEQLHVSLEKIGSLTVGFNDDDLDILKSLQQQGLSNGVTTHIIEQPELAKMEPNLSPDAKYALYAPTAMIIDPFLMTVSLMENAIDNGVSLFLNETVTNIIKTEMGYQVITNKTIHQSSIVINASGLNSDHLASFLGDHSFHVNPRKGSYYVFDHFDNQFLNHIIFPLPDAHSKGIVITKTTSNNYMVGPHNQLVNSKEDFSTEGEQLQKIKQNALKLVPNLPFNRVIRLFSGLRASANTGDFIIRPLKDHPHFINIAGIESPGFASAPAIATYTIDNFIRPLIKLTLKANYNPHIRPRVDLNKMSDEQINQLISKDPTFGHIICRCEHISEGQILDELMRSCPPRSVKAMKKRTRAGAGRCQGGFCQPHVIRLISEHNQSDVTNVNYDQLDTPILLKGIGDE